MDDNPWNEDEQGWSVRDNGRFCGRAKYAVFRRGFRKSAWYAKWNVVIRVMANMKADEEQK